MEIPQPIQDFRAQNYANLQDEESDISDRNPVRRKPKKPKEILFSNVQTADIERTESTTLLKSNNTKLLRQMSDYLFIKKMTQERKNQGVLGMITRKFSKGK